MEWLPNGLLDAFTLSTIMYIAMGVLLGLTVGAIPGLSAPKAIALGLPLTYTLNPIAAIGFLAGISKGGAFGGSISAILLNTPGSGEAVVTTLDGFPLCKQGKALKAIKLALISSVIGDLFSTLLVICVAATIASYAVKMGSSETFSLIMFSLTLIAALESASLTRGLLAICMGMIISLIGIDPVLGGERLTFGIIELESGITMVGFAIGLLAFSAIIIQTEEEDTNDCSGAAVMFSDIKEDNNVSFKEFKSVFRTIMQSSLIGSIIGALPGLGANVAGFFSYGVAKKTSKDPEKFGKGSLEGVAAAESANNAVISAAFIPLFTLGIPGSVATAILIGAFVMHGVQPGPLIFSQSPEVVYGIYGALIIGNLWLIVLGYYGIRFFAKLLCFPRNIILPIILFFCVMGAYYDDHSVFALVRLSFFILIGYFYNKANLSIVCLIVGFILGPLLELSFQQMYISTQGNLLKAFSSPITLGIWIALFAFVAWQVLAPKKPRKL